MENISQVPKVRSTLLFLLFPLLGELLFIDTTIKDVYARRRIRIMFSLFALAIGAIAFYISEIIIKDLVAFGVAVVIIPPEFRYAITGLVVLSIFILFCIEVWPGRVSLEDQIVVAEDQVSLLLFNPQSVFITLNRILNAIQLRRHQLNHCDNSRLAGYALAVLSEYLRWKLFSPSQTSPDS